MKSVFYFLAVAAISAAGFFGWSAKEKQTEKIGTRKAREDENKSLSADIDLERKHKIESDEKNKIALQEQSDMEADLDIQTNNVKVEKKQLEELLNSLEEVKVREQTALDAIAVVEAKFPGIPLDQVEAKVNEMKAEKNDLDAEIDDLDLFKGKLEKEIITKKEETDRSNEKISAAMTRVAGNTFQASITAVDPNWDFVVIAAGEKSGLTGDSTLLVTRSGRLLAKLEITQLEANRTIADIIPGSAKKGVTLRAGDQVILEKVRSN